MCRQVSEFHRVCERRKLRVNVGKSKVIMCSMYLIVGRTHVRLNGELSEEVNCFKYLVSLEADGDWERDFIRRMSAGSKAWGAFKSMLRNRGLRINAKKCQYEGIIAPMTLHITEAWGMKMLREEK